MRQLRFSTSLPPLISRLAVLVLACLVLVGCKLSVARLDREDRELPLMERAMTMEQGGNLDEAIVLYDKLLLESPRAASAHLNLALLLHDYQKDYIAAIFHYRQYLKQRPDTQKRAMLEDRLRLAEQLLAAKLARGISVTPGLNTEDGMAQQMVALREQVADAEKRATRLLDDNRALKTKLEEAGQRERRVRRQLELLQAADLVDDSARVRPPGTTSWTYVVVKGDSLRKIAKMVYNDESLYTRIRDANRAVLGNNERLIPGQELVIP